MSSARAPVVQARPCATLPRGKGPAPLEDGYRAMSAHQRIFTDRGGGLEDLANSMGKQRLRVTDDSKSPGAQEHL